MVTRASSAFTRWLAILAAATIVFSGAGVIATAQASEQPSVEATAIPAGGGEITITGKGFSLEDPGFYVVVTKAGYEDLYEAYEAQEFTRTEGVLVAANVSTSLDGGLRTLKLNPNGSFTLPLEVTADGDLAVYTSKAHGAGKLDTSQNTVTPLTRSDRPAEPKPTTEPPVLEATAVPDDGGEVTVTGRNFRPEGVGVVVIVGPADMTDLYTGAQEKQINYFDATRVARGLPAEELNEDYGVPTQPMASDGTFSFDLTVPAEGDWAVFSSLANGQGAQDKSQDAKVVLQRASETGPEPEPTETVEPAEGLVTMTGDLTWGVRESFRRYIVGPIAHGAVELDGAGMTGDLYTFPAKEGRIDEATGLGIYSYTGMVRFTGHNGIIDLRISDPEIRQTDENTADLVATVSSNDMTGEAVDYGRIVLGNVTTDNAVGQDGAISVEDAAVTLSAQGSNSFANMYPEGAELDPVTFTADVTSKETTQPSEPGEPSEPAAEPTQPGDPTRPGQPADDGGSNGSESDQPAAAGDATTPRADEGNAPASGKSTDPGAQKTATQKTTGRNGELPKTGADDPVALAAAAGALLLVGGILAAAGRHRRDDDVRGGERG